jgi:hypothetical protein
MTMQRRIFIFAFLLGLLGSAHAALACATKALVEDCCPSGMEIPCHHPGGGNDPTSDSELCSLSTPISEIATVPFKKTETEPLQLGSGDVVATVSVAHGSTAPVRGWLHSRSSPDPNAGRGAGIYLRTLRLRL